MKSDSLNLDRVAWEPAFFYNFTRTYRNAHLVKVSDALDREDDEMPIYEYRCTDCGRRTSVFTRSMNDEVHATCRFCGSENVSRLVSRVSVVRSEEARLESLADPSNLAGLDEDDPRSLGRFMRQMSQEMGEDLGSEFDEVVDRLESGQSPEDIEDAMPDLGEDVGGGMGGDLGAGDFDL